MIRRLPIFKSICHIHLNDIFFYIYRYLDGLNIKKFNIFHVRIRFCEMIHSQNMKKSVDSAIAT